MASMTCLEMSGSGSATGMTRIITRTARPRTRRDRQRARPKWSVAAPGAAVRKTCVPRIEKSICCRSEVTARGSGVRRIRSPWVLALPSPSGKTSRSRRTATTSTSAPWLMCVCSMGPTSITRWSKQGWCWWYRMYAPGETVLEGLETDAREAKKGILIGT